MKVCVYGAGGIGAYLAAALARADCEVRLVDRGSQLQALVAGGLQLINDDTVETFDLPAYAPGRVPGSYDYLIVAVKCWSLPDVLEDMAGLLGPDSVVVSAHNGIPWWYFHPDAHSSGVRHLDAVDPDARQWQLFGPERALGCVIYPACERVASGVVRHVSGNRIALGEPDGVKSERVLRLAAALRAGGIKAPVKADIRNDLWLKLIGNLAFNPLSVLTGYTLEELCRDPDTRALARKMMDEGCAVGAALGARIALDVEQRIEGAAAVGAHKTSMLQDFESGEPLELDPIVGAVRELGRLCGCPTPAIDSVHAQVIETLRGKRSAVDEGRG